MSKNMIYSQAIESQILSNEQLGTVTGQMERKCGKARTTLASELVPETGIRAGSLLTTTHLLHHPNY